MRSSPVSGSALSPEWAQDSLSPSPFIPSTHLVRTGTGHVSPDEIRQLEGVYAVLLLATEREVQLVKMPLQK